MAPWSLSAPTPCPAVLEVPPCGEPSLHPLISPRCDAASLSLGFDRMCLPRLERRNLDLLIRHHAAFAIEELDDQVDRHGRDRLSLRGLRFASGSGSTDGGCICCGCEL